jgi:predicted DNA-binding transcriptional regulator AlpA
MSTQADAPPRRIYRDDDLQKAIPVHPTTRLRWERKGLFPRRIVLGENSIGWYADEVDEWIESRARATEAGRPSPNPRAGRRSAA